MDWNDKVAILGWYNGGGAHKIFDDPNWNEHFLFDLRMAIHFWNEIYVPIIRGSFNQNK